MSELVAIAYPDVETAERVRQELIQATKEHILQLEDAVVVEHQADGKRRTRLAVDQDPRGEVGQGRAAGGDQLGEPEEREVALLEDGEHRRLRRRNSAGQGLLQLPCVYGPGRAPRATVWSCRVTLGGPLAGV